MIPQTFEQWKQCITQDCGIALTKEFAKQRLAVYENSNHEETKKFIQLYGKEHMDNIIKWFKQI